MLTDKIYLKFMDITIITALNYKMDRDRDRDRDKDRDEGGRERKREWERREKGKEVRQEERNEGMEEGKKEGREKGREEGRIIGGRGAQGQEHEINKRTNKKYELIHASTSTSKEIIPEMLKIHGSI